MPPHDRKRLDFEGVAPDKGCQQLRDELQRNVDDIGQWASPMLQDGITNLVEMGYLLGMKERAALTRADLLSFEHSARKHFDHPS